MLEAAHSQGDYSTRYSREDVAGGEHPSGNPDPGAQQDAFESKTPHPMEKKRRASKQ